MPESPAVSGAPDVRPEAKGLDPSTPCLVVWVDEGGDEQPKRHYVPFEQRDGDVHIGYTEIGGRAFMRTLGDALIASDRVVRIEYFPLPPWGETPEG